MLELLVTMMIAGILATIGIRSMITYGQSQSVVTESYLIKDRLKGLQNSAINMQLSAEDGSVSPTLCENNWLYGVEVEVTNAGRRLTSRRIFKSINTGNAAADKIANREASALPRSNYKSPPPNGYDYAMMSRFDIDSQDVVIEIADLEGPGGTLVATDMCKYIAFRSVIGNVILPSGADQCIVYIRHTTNDNYSRGYIFHDNEPSVTECKGFESCFSLMHP